MDGKQFKSLDCWRGLAACGQTALMLCLVIAQPISINEKKTKKVFLTGKKDISISAFTQNA